ncbi:MAG: CAAX prenyl protease-related protein [bacterium]|nr:CAAX prenyl protease-related protein [bacterium]
MIHRLFHLTQRFDRREESALPRILPFALFIAFVALTYPAQWAIELMADSELTANTAMLWLYPFRIIVVLMTLLYYWPVYTELHDKLWVGCKELAFTTIVGVVVYWLWVRMDWPWAMQSEPEGYNPFQEGASLGLVLVGIRIFGAVVVVPLVEELFWRSFLIRFLIKSPYTSVPLGSFTPLSFGAIVVLFGLEHHLWLAGMMAGAAYNLLLYKTGRLWPCIVAHGLTNLILSLHVLTTHEWQWW